ncbi:MAG TPA: TldD/PmbA family protein [Solirubrobacterales bacterium]|jgi:PmbA protein
MELAEAARLSVEAAVAEGASDSEAYALRQSGREVRVHGGKVESLSAATERGVGLRAWIGGRAGYAFGTELSEEGLRQLGARVVTAARIADEDEHAAAPQADGDYPQLDGLRDPAIADWPADRLVELTLAVERAATSGDRRVQAAELAVYAGGDDELAIYSSTGIECSYEASNCYAYVRALAEDEGSREPGLGFGVARSPAGLDADSIGAEGAERAAAMVGADKPPSQACPVVFDPTVAAAFAGLIGSGLGADSVQRGRSPFADLLGEEVASEALVLHDDGLEPEGLGASPCDDEGTPRARTALIEGGRLRTFLFDAYTARRSGADRAGNARRSGYRSPPSVGTSNLIVQSGNLTTAELLAMAGDGVYVTDMAGLHAGVNPVNGVFSVGASGRMIKGGELADPVREFTIASDLVSMLRAVREAGSEARWVPFGGIVRTPPLLIAEMTIGGN